MSLAVGAVVAILLGRLLLTHFERDLWVLLYADIIDLDLSDATITRSGNRVLLYIWPVLLYWVSCSHELRRLFTFPVRTRRPSVQMPPSSGEIGT